MGGFFTFGLNLPIRDEIDFELLSNDLGHEMIFTNVFEDNDFSASGDFAHARLFSQASQVARYLCGRVCENGPGE